jgi:hypothetical protein
MFYIVDLCLIKIAILLFYNYVASSHKSFHRIVKTLMGIVIASSFGMLIAGIFSCNPPKDAWSFQVFWDSVYGKYTAVCYNPTILWLFSAVFNLVTDCVIWFLPIPFVLNLRIMPVKRRLELAAIFSIGIMAVAASAVRLWVVTKWSSSFEQEGLNTANLMIWGQVEQHAGIISASIPFLRPLFRKAFKAGHERQQPSPSPAAKLIAPQFTPDANPLPPRTPIIPSPSPTFGSQNAPFRAPASPLSPIEPVQSGIHIGSTV